MLVVSSSSASIVPAVVVVLSPSPPPPPPLSLSLSLSLSYVYVCMYIFAHPIPPQPKSYVESRLCAGHSLERMPIKVPISMVPPRHLSPVALHCIGIGGVRGWELCGGT